MNIDNIKTFREHPRRRTFVDFSLHRINYILPLIDLNFVPETSHNTEGKHLKRIHSVESFHRKYE